MSNSEHILSYYAVTAAEKTHYPELDNHLSTDVCIIGGGFSGVATALELTQRGYSVVVLESKKIGWGATGRNGGQLIRGIGHGLEAFLPDIGQEGVDAIDKMGVEAVSIVRERIWQHQINCDLKMGYLDAAIKPRHLTELKADKHNLERLGYQALELIEQSRLSELVGTDRYIGGLLDKGSGHLHPLNLCIAEARVAREQNALLFEQSAATKIQYGEIVRVKTDKGQISCDQLVICTNAYHEQLEPRISSKVLPAGSYIIATEPLPESIHKKLLPNDIAVCDMGVVLDYFRLSADKRLLFGGMCNYSGREPKNIVKSLRPKMLQVFPELNTVNIDYAWGGMLGIGANRMPQIGRLEPNVYFAQAYSGHGVNATHMAGRVIAEAIDGYSDRFDIFNKIKHITFPGGRYLRSPLLAAGMMYYRLKNCF